MVSEALGGAAGRSDRLGGSGEYGESLEEGAALGRPGRRGRGVDVGLLVWWGGEWGLVRAPVVVDGERVERAGLVGTRRKGGSVGQAEMVVVEVAVAVTVVAVVEMETEMVVEVVVVVMVTV